MDRRGGATPTSTRGHARFLSRTDSAETIAGNGRYSKQETFGLFYVGLANKISSCKPLPNITFLDFL